MTDTALVIMARYPELGKTKTRLARTIGDAEALALYRAFLTDLTQRHTGQSYELCWAYTPAEVDYQAFVATLAPDHVKPMRCFPQQGPELGARLHAVFQWTQHQGFRNTIVIGSDSPHIKRETIISAKAALDEADVVLGPADDGGYYLLAMRHPYDVFSGIPMSTAGVTQLTIEAARRQHLTVRLIEPLFDVDELADLLRLAQLLEVDSAQAPATAAHVATIRSLYDHSINHSTSHTTSPSLAAFDLHRADEPL